MDPKVFKKTTATGTDLRHHIGNAMSVNVVERIILNALKSAGHISSLPHKRRLKLDEVEKDRWAYCTFQEIYGCGGVNSLKRSTKRRGHKLAQQSGRAWLVDSGASFHLCSEHILTAKERSTIRNGTEIPMTTANGIVWAKKVADVGIEELDITVTVYILENTPAVLSMGLLVEDFEMDSIWMHGQCPYLMFNGTKYECHPLNNVPLITVATKGELMLDQVKAKSKIKAIEDRKAPAPPATITGGAKSSTDEKLLPPLRGAGSTPENEILPPSRGADSASNPQQTEPAQSECPPHGGLADNPKKWKKVPVVLEDGSSSDEDVPLLTDSSGDEVNASSGSSNSSHTSVQPPKVKKSFGKKVKEQKAGASSSADKMPPEREAGHKGKKSELKTPTPKEENYERQRARRAAKKKSQTNEASRTCEHNIFTHFPKNDPDCDICNDNKCREHL